MAGPINLKAWLIASGVGTAAALAIGGFSIAMYLLNPQWARDPQAMINSPAYTAVTFVSLCAYLIYAGIGVLYAWLARREGLSISVIEVALGGFLSVLTVLIFQYVLSIFNTLFLMRSSMDASFRQLESLGFSPQGNTAFILGILCFSFCFALILGGGLGAGAAAITASVMKSPSPAPSV